MTAKLDPMRLLPHIAMSTPRNVFCIAAHTPNPFQGVSLTHSPAAVSPPAPMRAARIPTESRASGRKGRPAPAAIIHGRVHGLWRRREHSPTSISLQTYSPATHPQKKNLPGP